MSVHVKFQFSSLPRAYFSGQVRSGQVRRTTGTVIIELAQSSKAGARLSLAIGKKKSFGALHLGLSPLTVHHKIYY